MISAFDTGQGEDASAKWEPAQELDQHIRSMFVVKKTKAERKKKMREMELRGDTDRLSSY